MKNVVFWSGIAAGGALFVTAVSIGLTAEAVRLVLKK
jgi:hypothetical protein